MELLALDVIGTIAFTVSGYIIGVRNKLDILGIIIISFISAFGGGVIRDLLVDRTPFVFSENYPLLISLSTVIIAYLLNFQKYTKLESNKIFVISDTIGLAVYAYTGAMIGLHYQFNFMGVVFLALLTATGGGIIRDIMINKVPYVFKEDFYGTVAIIIGMVVFLTYTFLGLTLVLTLSIITFGVALRLLAVKFKWKLPTPNS